MKKALVGMGIAAALLAGCAKKQQTTAAPAAQKPAAAAPAVTNSAALMPTPPPAAATTAAPQIVNAAPSPVPQTGVITGKVAETMNAAGYTYVKLKTLHGDVWAAVPKTNVTTGATLTILGNMAMDDFESKTLQRKFAHIIFGNVVQPGQIAAAGPPPAAGNPMPHPGTLVNAQKADLTNIQVEKASGADAKTIAEIWDARSLKDAPVTVRGKVVKFLPEIMGKNWIHIRDGSGSTEKGDNDLTVTTKEAVKVGDVVTIKGTLRRDKDFGAGYIYAVIVEDASVNK